MSKSDYKDKMLNILNDTDTYKISKFEYTSTTETKNNDLIHTINNS